MNAEVVFLWKKRQIVVLMYLSNVLSQIVTIHVGRSRNGNQYCYGKVLVIADICIVRERV